VTEYNTPVPGIDEFKGSVLFVQDSITKDRLAINAGLRFEHTDGFLPPQSKAAGPFSAAQTTPRQDVIKWNNLAPRLGLVYDLTGNHKSAVKVGYARYHHQIGGGHIDVPNPLGLAGKATPGSTATTTANSSPARKETCCSPSAATSTASTRT